MEEIEKEFRPNFFHQYKKRGGQLVVEASGGERGDSNHENVVEDPLQPLNVLLIGCILFLTAGLVLFSSNQMLMDLRRDSPVPTKQLEEYEMSLGTRADHCCQCRKCPGGDGSCLLIETDVSW